MIIHVQGFEAYQPWILLKYTATKKPVKTAVGNAWQNFTGVHGIQFPGSNCLKRNLFQSV